MLLVISLLLLIGAFPVTWAVDAWHDNGKSIGRDFSESSYYSQSNALNESVFDMIIRLNEVSLAIYKQSSKWQKIQLAEKEAMKKGRHDSMIQKDKSLLLQVSEGDMLLDAKDRRIEDKFITDPKTEFTSQGAPMQLKTAPITGQYFDEDGDDGQNELDDDSANNFASMDTNTQQQPSKPMASKWRTKYYKPTTALGKHQTTGGSGPTARLSADESENEINPTDVAEDEGNEVNRDSNAVNNAADQNIEEANNDTGINDTQYAGAENNGTLDGGAGNNDTPYDKVENNGTLYDEPINIDSGNNTTGGITENDDDEEIIPVLPTNQSDKENNADDLSETNIPVPSTGLAMNGFNYSDYKEPYAQLPQTNLFVPGDVASRNTSSNTANQQKGGSSPQANQNNVHESPVQPATVNQNISPVLTPSHAYVDPPSYSSFQSPGNIIPLSNNPAPSSDNNDGGLNGPKPTMGANKQYSYNHVWGSDNGGEGGGAKTGKKRNAMVDYGDSVTPFGRKLWVTRVIPYEINHKGTQRFKKATVHQKIRNMMTYISSVTCVKFRAKKESDNQWLNIYYGTGCYAEIGRKFWQRNETKMSLGTYCISEPIILHLLMHTLGFFHESARPDRDSFIKVNANNIMKENLPIFNRHYQYDFSVQNSPYDFRSISHFGNKAYAKNERRMRMAQTIESKYDINEPLGGVTLTRYDILHVNKLYHCGADYKGESKYDFTQEDDSTLKTGLSEWTDWSDSCLKIVNQGCVKLRQRVCLDEDLSNCPGVDKYGVKDGFDPCKDPKECEETPLVPHWSHWGRPSPCSRTCGDGITYRTRACNNPPRRNDMTCTGSPRKTTICRVKKCNADPFDTDFEKGWGAWKLNYQFKLIWQIWNNSASQEKNTGPNYDRFGGSGKYAVLRSRDTWKDVNKIGELLTQDPVDTSKGPKCLTFFFMMNGKSINRLNIFLRVNNRFFKVWQRKGHQGDDWQRGAISLPKTNVEYFIIIDGKTGLPNDSDIAVDDFQLDEGKCPKGIEGCYDYFTECHIWKKRGMCVTQFKILIFSCCKTCSGLDYTGRELDLDVV